MAPRVWSGFLSAAMILGLISGCGGGGGGGGTPPTPTMTPGFTTLSGMLVDDPSGVALAGERVTLEPWVAGATPLPSPQTTTAADGSFTLGGVANGHYLLVIGSDSVSPPDGRPTIHDDIMVSGGVQMLHAPVLPPIPLVTPPAAETNGAYRLTTLNANETPCLADFNAERTTDSLPQVVPDEWLVENARAIAEEEVAWNGIGPAPTPEPSNPYGYITSGSTFAIGGADCGNEIDAAFGGSNLYATASDTLWFGGTWYTFDGGTQAYGDAEFPRDPRGYVDPNVPNWP